MRILIAIGLMLCTASLLSCDQSKVHTIGFKSPKAKITQYSVFDPSVRFTIISDKYRVYRDGFVSAEDENGTKYLLTMPLTITPVK